MIFPSIWRLLIPHRLNGLRKVYLVLVVSTMCLFTTTGCWDSNELNDVAFIIGTGLDKLENGEFIASVQLADPSTGQSSDSGKASGDTGGYRVEEAQGKDLSDALANVQDQLPRRLITGHRQAIVVGEKLARSGIRTYLDEFVRNPKNSLRTNLFIIKEMTADDFLKNRYAFETFSAIAAGDENRFLSTNETTLRDFLFDAMSDATCPTLPVIDIRTGSSTPSADQQSQSVESPSFSISTAIFSRDLKLQGYLTGEQSLLYLWGVNKLKRVTLTEPILSGGLISLKMTQLRSNIRVSTQGGDITAYVTLCGKGTVIENHTQLSPAKLTDVDVIEQKLNANISQSMRQLILRARDQYKADIFGFGEAVHRSDPGVWRNLKGNWPTEFSRVNVIVQTDVSILHGGDLKTGQLFTG